MIKIEFDDRQVRAALGRPTENERQTIFKDVAAEYEGYFSVEKMRGWFPRIGRQGTGPDWSSRVGRPQHLTKHDVRPGNCPEGLRS